MANPDTTFSRANDPSGDPLRKRRLSPSLRACLFVLTMVTVLPPIGLLGLKGYQDYRTSRTAALQQTLEVARGMRQTVDAKLSAYVEDIQVLAETGTLASGDLEGFARRAEVFASRHPGTNLGLLEPNGLIVGMFEAGQPSDRLQGVRAANNGVARAVETRRPSVSDFFVSISNHQPSFSVNVPVERDGKVIYVLSYNPTFRALQALIADQHLPPDRVVSIFDSADVNVARVPNEGKYTPLRSEPENP